MNLFEFLQWVCTDSQRAVMLAVIITASGWALTDIIRALRKPREE